MTLDPTIAAIATAHGPAGIAVIRLSGPQAWGIARRVFKGHATPPDWQHGHFYHGWIHPPDQPDRLLDEVLLLAFTAPHSFTGEHTIEIQGHGSPALSRHLLDCCLSAGATLAEPGEFTRRAFLNGRLDLTQAESVLDLIAAQGEQLQHLAVHNLRHRSLGQRVEALAAAIIPVQADITAHIDFPDEVDAPDRAALSNTLEALRQQAEALMQGAHQRRAIHEGLKVALLGKPNAGKSSLFNALLATERAIVTEIAGTTRDMLTDTLVIRGLPVTLIDTAGLRDSHDVVEKLGVAQSHRVAHEADAILYLYDAASGLDSEDKSLLAEFSHIQNTPFQVLAARCDLVDPSIRDLPDSASVLRCSAITGEGLPAVQHWLADLLDGTCAPADHGPDVGLYLNQRQAACVEAFDEHLHLALQTASDPALPLDLITVPLSDALYALDRLTGKHTTERMLDDVFSRFCVGK